MGDQLSAVLDMEKYEDMIQLPPPGSTDGVEMFLSGWKELEILGAEADDD